MMMEDLMSSNNSVRGLLSPKLATKVGNQIYTNAMGDYESRTKSGRGNMLLSVKNEYKKERKDLRLSPIASAMIQQKHGVYIPPTHVTQPSKSTRILSPACSPALRNHFQQNAQVHVPDLTKPYRHRTTIAITEQSCSKANDDDPMSSMSTSLFTKGSSYDGCSYISKVPFYPARYDVRTGAVDEATNAFINASIAENNNKAPSLFASRAPKVMIRKRAVIIGIAYKDSKFQRESLVHGEAAQKWFDTLVRHLEFLTEEIWILCDISVGPIGRAIYTQPTYDNIQNALTWLTKDAQSGDRLFLSYNGDIAYQKTKHTDVTTPLTHAIVPSDYPNKPAIHDHQLHDIARRIKREIDLTIFLDCRMSWNLIRLPFVYLPFKATKDSVFQLRRALTAEHWDLPHLATPSGELIPPSSSSLSSSLSSLHITNPNCKDQQVFHKHLQYFENYRTQFNGLGSVVCFAATPARYHRFRRYKSCGANSLSKGHYTHTIIDIIEQHIKKGTLPTYRSLMFDTADYLSPSGTMLQVPQVCSTDNLQLDKKIPL